MTKKTGQVSTDCFSGTKFPQHGKITISVNNRNIIVYRAEGPFNTELLDALNHIENEVLKTLKNDIKRWGAVIIFEVSCMALDDLMIAFGEYLKKIKSDDLQATATAYVITRDIEGRGIMAKKYQKCYDDAGITFSTFDNEQGALLWINSHLDNSI